MKNYALLFLFLLSHTLTAQELSIYPNGIHLPALVQDSLPAISTPGHLLFNLTHNRPEIFTQNFQWEGFLSDRIVDKDKDTEVLLNEGPIDNIEFRTDNTRRLSISSNAGGIGNLVLHGNSNTFIGASSGRDATSATHNIAIGSSALANNEAANYNIAIGSDALKNMNTQEGQTQFGKHNTAIGTKAMENADGFSGDNVAIGYEAGASGGFQSVFLGYQAGKEASDLSNTLFINNTEGDDALIFGKFDQGKVVINSNGGTVEDALLINGTSSKHGPMRVKVDGATKFRVHNNGGLSIGTHAAPFDNGLKVANLDEAGPPTPLYADDRGNVTRRSGMKYISIGPMNFEGELGHDFSISYDRWSDRVRLADGPKTIYAPVHLPHGATIEEFRGWMNFSNTPESGEEEGLQSRIRLVAAHYTPQLRLNTTLVEYLMPATSGFVDNTEVIFATDIDHVIDNINYHYFIEAYDNRSTDESSPYGLLKFTIGYEY